MTYLPVSDYEGLYEVSELGDIRSLDRTVLGKDGTYYPFKGRSLKPAINSSIQYLQVSLWKEGVGTSHYVHRLVAKAHVKNPLDLPEVNHLDGDRTNPVASNLEWCTSSQNSIHASVTGLRVYTNRLTKDQFIECLEEVIAGESYASLVNRVPYKVPFLSVKIRAIAKELGLEHELNNSLYIQKVDRARVNGAKNS